jgi:hypothetical protein
LIGYVTLPLLAVTAVGAVLAWRNRPRQTAVLLTWILVLFVIALVFPLAPYPRHVMYLIPPAVVLMAYALVQAARWARRRLSVRAAAIGCSTATALLLAPAAVLDGDVLADPAHAHYPGLDYWQYVAGWPSGVPWQPAAELIRQQGTGRRITILAPGDRGILPLVFWHDRRYVFVSSSSALARAQFVVADNGDLSSLFATKQQAQEARRRFVLLRSYARPARPCSGHREARCGETVSVFGRRG